MNAINQCSAKSSRGIFFIVAALAVYTHPSFCEGSKTGANAEVADKEYKSLISEFQSAFGRQMEKEFNLTWLEGGFLHNFAIDKIEFYAYRRATLEEARALELAIMNKLTEAIRENPKIPTYLNMLSLTPESIRINIHFIKLHHYGYDDGSIDWVYSWTRKTGFQNRYLHYTSTDPFSDYSDSDKDSFSIRDFEESFEDAVKLNAANSVTHPDIHESTGFENELDQILTSFKEEMKEKHSLLFQSIGWMVAGKSTSDISEIRAKCTYLYPVNCREARELMLLTTEKLLTALNNSETLRPYLKEYPFSASRLKLRTLFRKYKHFSGDVPYYDGSMESAVLNGNAVTYYHHIPNIKDSSMHDRVVYAKESYQEAQKTFENMPLLTSSEKIIKGMKDFIFNFSGFLDLVAFIFSLICLFVLSPGGLLIISIIIVLISVLRRVRRLTR